jgi:Family of unknown function (DUF5995)
LHDRFIWPAANGRLTPTKRGQLLNLSDTRGLRDLGGAAARVATIADIFAERADPRGVFPLIYRIGLDAIVAARVEGRFRDPDWVQTFDIAFAKRYLDDLHRHLREEKTTAPWEEVYRRTDADATSTAAVVAAALNAHLVIDMPEALHASGVRASHLVDHQTLSRIIWATAPTSLAAIEDVYGVDLSPLYHGTPLTWPINALTGRTAATQEQLFHAISAVAFGQGMAMANALARPLIRAQITSSWRALSVVVAQLEGFTSSRPA